ncbi:MAG: universal stress protein [Planctomycetota bacterium]|jgi:nucleotide-binding universal stress UspA family protein
MIKRILVGLGGTPYTPVAIKRAVGLAKRYEGRLTGVTIASRERPVGLSELESEEISRRGTLKRASLRTASAPI